MKRKITQQTTNVLNDAIYQIATAHGVSLAEMINVQAGKGRPMAKARRELCLALREQVRVQEILVDGRKTCRYALVDELPGIGPTVANWLRPSLPHIAKLVGANHHTTILLGLRIAEAEAEMAELAATA